MKKPELANWLRQAAPQIRLNWLIMDFDGCVHDQESDGREHTSREGSLSANTVSHCTSAGSLQRHQCSFNGDGEAWKTIRRISKPVDTKTQIQN